MFKVTKISAKLVSDFTNDSRFPLDYFYSSVGGGGGSLIGGLDSYSEALSRHKAVLDDLHDLSRPLRPLSPSLLSATHHHHSGDNDVIESFIPRPGTLREISAYVLQHQQLADPVQVHFNCFTV